MAKKQMSRSQKAQFRKGFAHGKAEHKWEELATKLLLFGFVVLAVGVYMAVTDSGNSTYVLVAGAIITGITLFTRQMASYHHHKEKHYNDKLRYGKWRNQKSTGRSFLKGLFLLVVIVTVIGGILYFLIL